MTILEKYNNHDSHTIKLKRKIDGKFREKIFSIDVTQHIDFNLNLVYYTFYVNNQYWILDYIDFFKSIMEDYENCKKYGSVNVDMPDGKYLFQNIFTENHEDGRVSIIHKMPNGQRISNKDLPFCNKINVYLEIELDSNTQRKIVSSFMQRNISLTIYSKDFLSHFPDIIKTVFISHDSKDKTNIAKPLADNLIENGVSVWYDEYSLEVGDSLRESIEAGLMECEKCVLIISKNFLSNKRWTKAEYTSVFTRERVEEKRLFIPIWVDINEKDVLEYSPLLADTFAVMWDSGIENVVGRIKKIINKKSSM